MSDWKIELVSIQGEPALATSADNLWLVLSALQVWRALTKPQRAAVEAAYPDGQVEAHPATIRALDRHGFVVGRGFMDGNFHLTDAGKAVARWNVGKP